MAARIVVTEFVSLDGVMEAPGGEPDFKYAGWTFEFDRGDDGNQFKLAEARGRVRRQVQRDAEVRRLDDAQGPGVEQHDGPRQRRRDGPGAQAEGGVRRRAASAGEPPAGAGADRERPRRPDQPDGLPGDPRDGQECLRGEARATQPEAEGVEGRRRRRARADLRAGRRSQVATGQYPSKTRTKEMQVDKADPRAKLEPFQALIGEWTIEMTHPMVEDTVVRGRATYEWLEGGRFLIQRAVNEHPDFPDSLCVIGVMEGENDLSMQYFDSRGVHRVYAIGFDGRELTLERDAPGFAQRGSAKLSDDSSTLDGVWQLKEDDQGYHDDLAFTYRRASGGDG